MTLSFSITAEGFNKLDMVYHVDKHNERKIRK